MAIIYSYPTVQPTADDLVLGTDVNQLDKPTKNFTVQSLVDLVAGGVQGLGAVITANSSALNAAGVEQSATGFDSISGIGTSTFSSFANGTMNITGGTGTGFTSIISTNFTGALLSTGLVGQIASGVQAITQAPGTNNKTIATTEYVDSIVDPSILTFTGTTGGDQTVTLVNQTFSLLGTTSEIKTISSAQTLTISLADGAFGSGSELILPNGASATTQDVADNTVKVATTAFVKQENDAQDLNFSGDTGNGSVILGGPTGETFSVSGTNQQVTTIASNQTLTISLPTTVHRNLQGDVTGTILATSSIAGLAGGTDAQNVLAVTQNAGDDSTRIATTKYVDTAAGSKTLSYQADAAGTGTMPFTMNLSTDDLDIAGGTNINTSTLAVTAGADPKAVITVNLDDSVTISGTSKADTFTTTAGTATWTTTVLAGFTKITSALFVGDSTAALLPPIPPWPDPSAANVQFQGNASTANQIKLVGTINMTSPASATQGPTASALTYTKGGNISLVSSLLNTVVTAKTLQGLPTPAAATVVAGDTILEGIGKLQSQINGIANGLQFQGTWNASMDTGGADVTPNGTPALTSGGGEASSGTTDATTANELVDSTKNFTAAPNVVAVGDKVINQADGQEALVTAITNAASGRLELAADIMLTGEAYIIDKTPFITAGHYYVVDAVGATTARNATLNGIQDWQVGDWVIASVNNVWQKLNNSAVEGSGTENRLTKWAAAASTLVDSGIIDNGTTIKLENDTELGAASTDAISSVGVHTIDEQLILKKGLALNASYGASGQVLTSAGASADVPTWTTPTTGVVESITGGTGITVDDTSNPGTAAIPVVSIDYAGTDNAILAATAATETILTTDQIWYNDIATAADPPVTINTIKSAPISSLPFDNFAGWVLSDNEATANTTTIVSGGTAKFAGGTYITTGESSGTLTINHDATTRTSNTSTASPAFGATVTMFDDLQTNGTGHVTISNLKTVTLPSPVNFTPSPNGTDAGVAGYVPAPAAGTGSTAYFLNGTGTMTIPPNDQGVQTVNTTSPIEGGGSSATVTVSHKAVLTDASGTAGTYTSADVTVDGDGHITGIANGSGTFTFTGTRDFTAAAAASNLFTLTKPTTGTIVFNVMLTSTNNSDESICKAFYVARAHAVTDPPFNKLIDSGPDGSNDFAVTFVGDSTTGVECKIAATGADQSISFSVEVGYDSENTTVLTQP